MAPDVQQPRLIDLATSHSQEIATFIKWPGGKTAEREIIRALMPPQYGRYFDPFVGGGAILLSALGQAEAAFANDQSPDLMAVFSAVQSGDQHVMEELMRFVQAWEGLGAQTRLNHALLANEYSFSRGSSTSSTVTSLLHALISEPLSEAGLGSELLASAERIIKDKVERMLALEAKKGLLSSGDIVGNLHGAACAVLYYGHRDRYNRFLLEGVYGPERTASYYVLRELAYAAMFRFNRRGEFNVPFGGMSYATKNLRSKVTLMFSREVRKALNRVTLSSCDFEEFLVLARPTTGDFVFLDPPYDTEFSAYDGVPFLEADQVRLAETLRSLEASWLLVIKNTPLIHSLYRDNQLYISAFNKRYAWNIKSRYDGNVEHLAISNYAPPRTSLRYIEAPS